MNVPVYSTTGSSPGPKVKTYLAALATYVLILQPLGTKVPRLAGSRVPENVCRCRSLGPPVPSVPIHGYHRYQGN